MGIFYLGLRIALAAALYGFLAWALIVLWRELKSYAKAVEKTTIPALSLISSNRPETETREYSVAEITIGRDPTCNCYLNDKTISGKHARLTYRMGQWWVEDLHSTNGTFLNDEPVSAAVVLTTGDLLRCGQIIFEISINAPRTNETDSSGAHKKQE